MLMSGRPARPAMAMEAWPRSRPLIAHGAATPDHQKRIARLRELAREFRRILTECTVFDGRLPDTLRQVISDLEEEADKLELGEWEG